MRLVKLKSVSYGKQHFSVEARDEKTLNLLSQFLKQNGWSKQCTDCQDDTGYDGEAFSEDFIVDCVLEKDFRESFKEAKQWLKLFQHIGG